MNRVCRVTFCSTSTILLVCYAFAIILQRMENESPNTCQPDKWVERYADQLFRFAMSRVNHAEKAEDLVQDTFMSALNNLKGFKGNSSELTWLYTILRNKIIDYYRSGEKKHASKFYKLDDDSGVDHFFYTEGKNEGAWVEGNGPTKFYEAADKPLEREEFQSILKICMGLLPFKWSEVFRMKTIEELDSKEICKELGITSSNLWVIIHRAKLQMRECMENRWGKA